MALLPPCSLGFVTPWRSRGLLEGVSPPRASRSGHFAPHRPPPPPAPCSIIPNNQSSLKKTKRIFELTWPLFLGSLAEVSVLKYRHLDIERSHAFERFLEDHVGPLFELRFREVAGAEGEALAAADGDVGGGSTIFGDEAVRSRGQRCGTAAVRARASRCVLSGEGIITLAEAKQRGLRYTTFNVHDFEPIAGAGADTRLAISMALPVSNVGTAGGGAQLFGVHGKGDGLFRRSSPRDASQGRPYSGIFSGEGAALRSSASAGGWGYETGYETGVFAGADAVGRGSKASAGVFRGDRYALSVLRGDDTAAQDAETWTTAAQAPAPLLNSNSYGGDEEYGGRRGGGGDTTRAFRDNR